MKRNLSGDLLAITVKEIGYLFDGNSVETKALTAKEVSLWRATVARDGWRLLRDGLFERTSPIEFTGLCEKLK